MKGKRRLLMGLSLLAIGLVAFMALGPDTINAKATTYAVKLFIDDNFWLGYQKLFSDGKNGGWYIDHRLSDSDPCVWGWVDTAGGFFIYMYRGAECVPELHARKYRIIQNGAEITEDATKFRIRSEEKLFGRKGTTPVAFMFYKYDFELQKDISYEVRTDVEVPTTGAGNTRTLTYSGTATLWRITQLTKREKVPVLICSFPFPFQITVERVPQ